MSWVSGSQVDSPRFNPDPSVIRLRWQTYLIKVFTECFVGPNIMELVGRISLKLVRIIKKT